jgi:hypothetical protein
MHQRGNTAFNEDDMDLEVETTSPIRR